MLQRNRKRNNVNTVSAALEDAGFEGLDGFAAGTLKKSTDGSGHHRTSGRG